MYVQLKSDFDAICSVDDFIYLDSTTDEKFSHHVMLDKPEVVFADNFQLGLFVKDVCSKLDAEEREALSFHKDDRYYGSFFRFF